MKKLFIFIAGITVGTLATYKLVKDRYEKIAQEEIDSVKERFSEMKTASKDEKIKEDEYYEEVYIHQPKEEVVTNKYRNLASGYVKSNNTAKKEEVVVEKQDTPYLINPEEFGEFDEYEAVTLLYLSDGILTDDNYDLVDDVDDTVGLDSLKYFDEQETDSIFVRNDRLKCDYEILIEPRSYQDVVESMPYIIR